MSNPGCSTTDKNQTVDSAESLCGHCNKLVKNDSLAMECEICNLWYHIKCQGITKAEYEYIKGGSKKKSLSKLHWYCLTCDRIAVNFMKTMASLHIKHQILEDKVDNLEEKMKNKVDKEEVDQLKEEIGSIRKGQKQALEEQWKKIEENLLNHQKENTVKINKEDIISVNDVIEKKIKEKDVEERARKDRRNNMAIFGIKECEAMSGKEKQEVDLKEVQKILKDCCEVELKQDNVAKVIRMGKYTEGKKRPIIITIGTEEKKREIFKNLHKLRRSTHNITITHDLTVRQREELHELIKEAKNKEECDQSGRFIYRVRGPPWGWYVKKIVKSSEEGKA